MSGALNCPLCGNRVKGMNALRQHAKVKHRGVRMPEVPPLPPRVSDAVEGFRALKDFNRLQREKFGVPCPMCQRDQPRRQPTILLPGRKCRVHSPPYVDPRPELTQQDIDTL